MTQWNKLHWKDEHCVIGGITIRHKDGKIHTSHDLKFTPHVTEQHNMPHSGLHELDYSPEANAGMQHLGDGIVDHITVHPVKKPQGVSVHAIYRDKDGAPTGRQDTHFQL